MKEFDEQNLDVLQNIEFAIVEVYRGDRSLLDIDAQDAIDALARQYHAEEELRTPPPVRLSGRAQAVYQSVHGICEWRLGRSAGPIQMPDPTAAIPVSLLVRCLREIHKSIQRWSKQGGRKGYLDFVSDYLPMEKLEA